MRKLIIMFIFIAIISPVFAQNASDESIYYVNLPVERIYPTRDGYIIQYLTQSGLKLIGIPNEWFVESAGRADMVQLPPGRDWPSISVFYNNGDFTHLRLYVHASRGHWTWGSMPQGTDVSRFFEDRESFNLQF